MGNSTIIITVRHGEVISAMGTNPNTKVVVRDYDVEFPCVANNLKKDSSGKLYLEIEL